jgi:hypothetical protein
MEKFRLISLTEYCVNYKIVFSCRCGTNIFVISGRTTHLCLRSWSCRISIDLLLSSFFQLLWCDVANMARKRLESAKKFLFRTKSTVKFIQLRNEHHNCKKSIVKSLH